MSEEADVLLWGRRIGVVLQEEDAGAAVFGYEPEFARSGIQVSPLEMPLRTAPYSFPSLSFESFKGLPGMLSDSLPDRWGNTLIDTWLESQGRSPGSARAIERLCYTGARGIGALEYRPAKGPQPEAADEIRVDALVRLASEVLTRRRELVASVEQGSEQEAMLEILSVGMSAGGARAKAVIAWNRETNEIRSGQLDAPEGFEHWLLKFDGVSGNRDKERLDDPRGFGAIEFAYSLMAKAAGIEMAECDLLAEGPRRHFVTRRFDRPRGNAKLHMQSLAAIGHYDFNMAGAHSYEQAMRVIRRLGMPTKTVEQQFRRMAFNVVARNQDDHVKNIAFLMDQGGNWELSPAFDVSFNHNPRGDWTQQHQMTVNGKRDGFAREDLGRCADAVSINRARAMRIVDEVEEAVARWPGFAETAGVAEAEIERIGREHRLGMPRL
jgi:serine/threonine-protein kinase HipA